MSCNGLNENQSLHKKLVTTYGGNIGYSQTNLKETKMIPRSWPLFEWKEDASVRPITFQNEENGKSVRTIELKQITRSTIKDRSSSFKHNARFAWRHTMYRILAHDLDKKSFLLGMSNLHVRNDWVWETSELVVPKTFFEKNCLHEMPSLKSSSELGAYERNL